MKKTLKLTTIVTFFVIGLLLLTGCGEIKNFGFEKTNYDMFLGDTVSVTLNLDDKVDKANIVYSSSDPEVATFVKGTLKAVSVGETKIQISYNDGKKDYNAEINVNVKLTDEEQAYYDQALEYDNKVKALEEYKTSNLEAIEALVLELNGMDLKVLNYVKMGDKVIDMYNGVRGLIIVEMINAIPELVTVEDENLIVAARTAYKSAEAVVKGYVTNIDKLVLKEQELAQAIEDAIPDGVSISFKGDSYTTIKGNIVLDVTTIKKTSIDLIVWSSSDEKIATVLDGVVTGISEGNAQITATIEGTDVSMSVGVTIMDNNKIQSDIMKFILEAHNSRILFKNVKAIGYQEPGYYFKQTFGSVSHLLFKDLKIIEYPCPEGMENRPGEIKKSTQYITVHDTASIATTATASAHASYVSQGGGGTSWHYSVGNDGIYHQIPDNEVTYHAGDGKRNFALEFTDVPAKTGEDVVITLDANGNYAINGVSTKLRPYTDLTGTTKNPVNYKTSDINDAGIHYEIIGGYYYLGKTYYNGTYQLIANFGGNRNSIGIETMVNKGSDLYLTWQTNAKLVAKLLVDNDLDVSRVKPHHFFSGKNCPQTMRDNGLWQEFLTNVQFEYDWLKKYSEYKITCVSNDPDYLANNGRVLKRDVTNKAISYTLTVTNGKDTETITLYSVIPGSGN